MVRHSIRVIAVGALASACLSLAACTSGSTDAASAGQAARKPVAGGTVTVRRSGKVVCVMKVVNGKGTCTVAATKLGVGTKPLVAQYTGKGYGTSQSSPLPYTVVPASTTTTLTLSPATVAYGHEQAEHLAVKISPAHGGTPTGTVAVKYNGTPVCTIKLSATGGSCTLAASALPPGTRALTAIYAGDQWYRGSVSAAANLVVTK